MNSCRLADISHAIRGGRRRAGRILRKHSPSRRSPPPRGSNPCVEDFLKAPTYLLTIELARVSTGARIDFAEVHLYHREYVGTPPIARLENCDGQHPACPLRRAAGGDAAVPQTAAHSHHDRAVFKMDKRAEIFRRAGSGAGQLVESIFEEMGRLCSVPPGDDLTVLAITWTPERAGVSSS